MTDKPISLAGDKPPKDPTVPPRGSRARKSTARKAPVNAPWNANKAREEMIAMGTRVGAAVGFIFRDPVCSSSIIESAPDIAEALVELAERSPRVKAAITTTTKTVGWSALLLAVGGLGAKIAAHHGLVPPGVAAALGVEPHSEAKIPHVHGDGDHEHPRGNVPHHHGDSSVPYAPDIVTPFERVSETPPLRPENDANAAADE